MSIIEEQSVKEAKPYELSIAGFKLKLNSTLLAVAIPVLTTLGGAAWGGFQFYTDYMNMRAKIEKYIAPDLTTFDKRLAVIEENNQKSLDYTRDIKIDLKNDIRRLDDVVADVERNSKASARETDASVRDMRTELRSINKDVDATLKANGRDQAAAIADLKRDVDRKIKTALDNPLANGK